MPSKLCPEPLGSSVLPFDPVEDSKWFDIPATMRNTYGRLEVQDENLSINYMTISKLLTITWRTKKAFVSKIPKVSAPHKFVAPFGLYSLPTKAKIFLGPYLPSEFPKVSLLPFGGGGAFTVSSFTVHRTLIVGDQSNLRRILPKGSDDTAAEAKSPPKVKNYKGPKSKSGSASTTGDEGSGADGKKLRMKPMLQKLKNSKVVLVSKAKTNADKPLSAGPVTIEVLKPSPAVVSDSGEDNDSGDDCDQLANADHGYFSCSIEDVQTIPFILFGESQCQIKHPMGSKLLRFRSIIWAIKFLEYIYKDIYTDEVSWKFELGMASNNSLQDYAYVKSSKVSQSQESYSPLFIYLCVMVRTIVMIFSKC